MYISSVIKITFKLVVFVSTLNILKGKKSFITRIEEKNTSAFFSQTDGK